MDFHPFWPFSAQAYAVKPALFQAFFSLITRAVAKISHIRKICCPPNTSALVNLVLIYILGRSPMVATL
jgi:hypothetical protein